jgi:hypothetical protein
MRLTTIAMIWLLGVPSVFGQGAFRFTNRYPSLVPTPVYLHQVGGELAEGTNYMAQLFAGKKGTPQEQLIPIGPTAPFRTGVAAGWIDCQSCIRVIEGVPPGEAAALQLRAWSAKGGATYENALAAAQLDPSILIGSSPLFAATAGEASDPPFLVGLQAFAIASVLKAPVPLSLKIEVDPNKIKLSWPVFASNLDGSGYGPTSRFCLGHDCSACCAGGWSLEDLTGSK